jgi:hypothetical protein
MEKKAPLNDYENGLRIFARMIARAYRQELAEKRASGSGAENTAINRVNVESRLSRLSVSTRENQSLCQSNGRIARQKSPGLKLKRPGANHGENTAL